MVVDILISFEYSSGDMHYVYICRINAAFCAVGNTGTGGGTFVICGFGS